MSDSNTDSGRKPGFFARLKQRLNAGRGSGFALGWLSGRKLDEELESTSKDIEDIVITSCKEFIPD